MMQKRLLFLVAACLVSSESKKCLQSDYYIPCSFSLTVSNYEWREGSRVSGIECSSTCTETETVGARYKLEMLLKDKLIKKSEPRFEPYCVNVPGINSISPAISKCSLTVENVSRDDKGPLACSLYQNGFRLGGKNCTIKVLSKLRSSDLTLVQVPDDGAVVAGSSFSMTCLVNPGVYQPPIIRWVHNERVVKIERERGLLSTYNVSFLNETNAGGYECWVQNEQGDATKNLPKLFEAAVRPEIIEFSAAMDTNEPDHDVVVACKGHVVHFVCTGNGNPAPTVTVTHVKSGESSSLPQLASATAIFTVSNASRVDNGTYVCRAENKVAVVDANITLIVCESTPNISFYVSPKPSSSSRCVPVDGGFSLKCLAHGCPNPSIELIPPASTGGIVARNDEAVYKITNGSPNGAYVCRVSNVCKHVSKVLQVQLCTTDTDTPDIWVIVISTVSACLFVALLAVMLWPVAKRLHHSSRRVRIEYGEERSISSDTAPIVAATQDSGTLPPQMPE